MKYRRISAAEGAAMIENGHTLAFSGFTPNGVPKAVVRELRERAERLHREGHPFRVGIITGASSCQSLEGDLANAQAISFRAPFSTNADFRKHCNLGEIEYEDSHLGHTAERLRRGFYGEIDMAIIEVSDMDEGDDECRAYLTTAGGIVPTIARLARRIIIEINHFHSPKSRLLHDVYEFAEYPHRKPIPLVGVCDRIGTDYVSIDPAKIAGVVEVDLPEEARTFKEPTPELITCAHHVVDFFERDMKAGHIPSCMFPIQSGVGETGNAIMKALGEVGHRLPPLSVYSEVVQDSTIALMEEGKIVQASCAAMTVTNECVRHVYDNIDFFSKHLVIRPSEMANSPEIIRRLGIIAMNTALEIDLYGHENSSHICGSKVMNGIGGSCDYERNGSISIFYTASTAKNGAISSIVPMCSHVDSTEHDVDVVITEQGVADLRGKSPWRRAHEIIENCAHPDYRPLLRDYLENIAPRGHEPQHMRAALAFHDTFLRKGDMRLTDFSEYLK